MGNKRLILRGLAAAALLSGSLALVGCSRPTPAPGQQTPAPAGQEEGYPAGDEGAVIPPGPQPGEPGYPPPNPLNPTVEDPYPGQTATAAAAGNADEAGDESTAEAGGDATNEATDEAGGETTDEATATPTP